MCVCARRSLNGCLAEWASQWSFSDSNVTFGVTTKKQKTPRALSATRLGGFSQSKRRSQVRSWSTSASKRKKIIRKNMFRVQTWQILHFVISTEAPKKGNEASSSQCLLGKNNKGGGGLLWVKGMKVRLTGDYTVSQSVGACRTQTTCSFVWHNWQNATTHQFTLPAAVTVYRGGTKSGAAISARFRFSEDRRLILRWDSRGWQLFTRLPLKVRIQKQSQQQFLFVIQ